MDSFHELEFYSSIRELAFKRVFSFQKQEDRMLKIVDPKGIHRFIVNLGVKVRRKGWIWYSQENHLIQNAENHFE